MDTSARVFIDTSGFYSVLDSRDVHHEHAKRCLSFSKNNPVGFVTTDYILDETATLLKARGLGHLTGRFFTLVHDSRALNIVFIDRELFRKTQAYFTQYSDHAYSFTDCSSFMVMRDLGIEQALTHDRHFTEAGFEVLL